MGERNVFLSASWRDLLLLNFAVSDSLLTPRLPAGLELDRYDGTAYVSLVAFDFIDTRVLGVRWPGFTDFAEINLRFYVRRGDVRGVCFIREIVPQRLTALLARLLYNEPYVAAPLASESQQAEGFLDKTYRLRWRNREHRLAARTENAAYRPAKDSAEHFFKEHEWGFGRARSGATLTYRVEHPEWDVHRIVSYETAFDFAEVYGAEWALLNGRTPDSACFAVGSAIKVFGKS